MRQLRQLEELNLVDNFLMNSLTSHEVYGELAARCILECILGRKLGKIKVIPQRIVQGDDTDKHGIRMDVYLDEEDGELFDLEPDNNDGKGEVAALSRRVRFYHAKLDAGSLQAGEKYSVLRNVVVIFITTYDPFALDRMVYTIKNGCVEVPELPYEDGARTIFLYTQGKKGNSSEDLRELLSYMEDTSKENARTEELQRLHEMVTAVKRDGKVGLAYMKSFEIEERIRKEGRTEGLAEAVLNLLGRLGDIPSSIQEMINAQKEEETLCAWLNLAAEAKSIAEFTKQI
ncbi:MAG: Rpn family recombination-promoting nuclease/putative transposase [Lachnospiraceae bacterium]|nr:Rpn family recombination-promoting nuclease/putative transposase [Lachnospiraceae bacterium]MDE7239364.1 Rpn family recombination-promoting nuclease/putative transposase [Lachnospiraceae bacterium]